MIQKLLSIETRYNEIENALQDGAVYADMAQYAKLSKEYKTLQPVVEKFREYKAAQNDISDAETILAAEKDAELCEMAETMRADAKRRLAEYEDELRILLIPKDPSDDKNVIIEIRAGAGGEEAALFAYVLYRMYNMYADAHGYKCELLYANDTELGGFKEVSFLVSGAGAFSRFKFESGVHRVQRVPETESQGRIQTSTATVAVLPEAEEDDFVLNMDELEISRHRSAGAGGQHVNKTESAIRIIHKPTGTVVDCQDERSQTKNLDKALKVMKSRLAELERSRREEARAGERRSQVGTGDRSERIRTYNYPQGRVTDHRIGMTVYNIEAFVSGRMDEMIDALITADRAEKLKNGEI